MTSTTMVGVRAPRCRLPVGRAGRWGKAKVTGLPQVASAPPPADGSTVPGRPGRWEQRPHRHPGSHIAVTTAQFLCRVRRWAACQLTLLPPAPARPRPPGTWPTPSSRSSDMSPAAARYLGVAGEPGPEAGVSAGMRPIVAPGKGTCLLYTSDAADEEDSVDLGGRR